MCARELSTGQPCPDHRADEPGTGLQDRLHTAAKLADALGDYLPGDGWALANAIARLCRGEITPAQAMEETEG
jgi:hypothetical protein